MATESRRARTALIQQLIAEPTRFDLFQAVRLVELAAHRAGHEGVLATDTPFAGEPIRFTAAASLSFAAAPLSGVSAAVADSETAGRDPADLALPFEFTVTCFGLTGPSGVLPNHYTAQLIERVRHRDGAMRAFFDLFNHRLISLFHRAWEKYRLPFAYERAHARHGMDAPGYDGTKTDDAFTAMLYSLVGLAAPSPRGCGVVEDEVFVRYGAAFAHGARPATALRDLLSDHFQLPVEILQFQGQWLHIPRDQQTRLGGSAHQLGQTTVVGERVWDAAGRFTLRIGPLTYGAYCRFVPGAPDVRALEHLVRMYIGTNLDFDVQPVLDRGQVPRCQLSRQASHQLGYNTGLNSGLAGDLFDGARFSFDL